MLRTRQSSIARFTLATVLLGAFAAASAAEEPPSPGLGEATFQAHLRCLSYHAVSREPAPSPTRPWIRRSCARRRASCSGKYHPNTVLAALTKRQDAGARSVAERRRAACSLGIRIRQSLWRGRLRIGQHREAQLVQEPGPRNRLAVRAVVEWLGQWPRQHPVSTSEDRRTDRSGPAEAETEMGLLVTPKQWCCAHNLSCLATACL